MPPSLSERLRKAGIRHYDVLIHDQDKDWLIKNFKPDGASAYPVNVARLIRNLVWQMKERIAAGEKEFHELIRTYWYMWGRLRKRKKSYAKPPAPNAALQSLPNVDIGYTLTPRQGDD